MFRRNLIALFALLSGLAALQAPVHASAAEVIAAHTRSFTGGVEAREAAHELCAFAAEARAEAVGRVLDTAPSFEPAPLPSLSVPYVVGVERALE